MKIIGVSADPPAVNKAFCSKHRLPFLILSDTEARIAELLFVPTSTKHPMALMRGYPNGFLQPAVFIFDAEGNKRFEWIQKPKVKNLFGASKRISPQEILEKATEIVSREGCPKA